MGKNFKLIKINENTLEFHLTNEKVSYLFRVMENNRQLEHLYFGSAIRHRHSFSYLTEREVRPSNNMFEGDHTSSLEHIKQEYPVLGTTDFRYPAVRIRYPKGDRISEFQFDTYRLYQGKPALEGLPAVYSEDEREAETLEIVLKDAWSDVSLHLFYTIFRDYDAIARSTKLINNGEYAVYIENAMSLSIDFPDSRFDFIHLNGAWARENHLERNRLLTGIQSVGSVRGASSHVHNPFMALARPETTEHSGEVYGFSFIYSGNFLAQVEVDTYQVTRAMIGIHPLEFSWKLEPGKSFQTPEAIAVYSGHGLNGMSQIFHELYRNRLVRGEWRNQERPVLINNWEATYFDFNEEKILEIARNAADLGIELFVLDDGWFGHRDDDTSSLGDWFVNRNKLPNGIKGLAEKIHALGLKFGLWFEPEMISKDTKLFTQHPDWMIHVPGKRVSHGRNQFVLDFSRSEVVDHIFELMDAILSEARIDYFKWDMNRYISEPYSVALPSDQQGEVFHRYILGVYRLYERLIQKYPYILFESCAGGGGRFDPGMLYYAPQAWASDDTDAVERLKIQYGTSLVYPLSSIGSHVSAVPNHQVGRITSLQMRTNVAYFGTFGYELDITTLEAEEKEQIRRDIAFFKEHRKLIQEGRFIRLLSPFEGNETAWMVVSEDHTEAIVAHFEVLAKPNRPYERLRLQGLSEGKKYQINEDKPLRYGDDLMQIGLLFGENFTDRADEYWEKEKRKDFNTRLYYLKALDEERE
ncbi:alpha-galactosidase [Caldifermentibacillus hisashii]|uniref:alpha-galactosidase n=1 Tax=Caldifermentibacillus hisashii TaxID=996558 RepID=UPI0031010199